MKKCQKCAEMVQDDAKKCRFCGEEFGFKPPKIGCLGATIIGIGGFWMFSTFQNSDTPEVTQSPISVSAGRIVSDYRDNEAAARKLYDKRMVSISGIVGGVDLNAMNEPVIHLYEDNPHEYVTIHLSAQSQPSATHLKAGQRLTVVCPHSNVILRMPLGLKCVI